MSTFYPLRRVPEAFSALYLYRRTLPLLGPLAASTLWTAAAQVAPTAGGIRDVLGEGARDRGSRVFEAVQSLYFSQPGLDTLTVRELSKFGSLLARVARIYLWLRVSTGTDADLSAQRDLQLIPSRGYDSLMMAGLAVGNALGLSTGGEVHSRLWWDSDHPELRAIPEGHPSPAVRRLQAPRTLGDLAADIDDLAWADAYGQSVKVTRVGEGASRRWLVSVPGTDHGGLRSQPNPADYEANMQEELNIASSVRLGVVKIIHQAMGNDGITREQRAAERVLICGHSQGGIIAVALAATDPQALGFAVDGVITLGSPVRRWELREAVTMLAVEHDQDIIPAMDGTPRREADQRAVVRRSLVQPRLGALVYAHSPSTYTDTVRKAERQEEIVAWGQVGKVIRELQDYLPRGEESVRVTHHYTWQDLVEPIAMSTWEEFLRLERPEWEPVSFGGEVEVSSTLPPTPQEVLSRVKDARVGLPIPVRGKGNV